MTIMIFIVDDHAIVRQGLRVLLTAYPHIEVVGEADNGADALLRLEHLQPHVVLMDLLMPTMDGVTATQQLKTRYPHIKVLALTSSIDDALVTQAIQAGADGYMLKASRAGDVVYAIECVAKGKSFLDPAATHVLVHHTRENDPLSSLTPREREVFDWLARGANSADVAQHLGVSEATIRTHTASLLEKLRLRDRAQVIIFALKRGLVRPEELP